jgi:hypothetical protein
MYSVCLTGGSPKGPQIRGLEQGCDFVVATPGRINDIIEMGKVGAESVACLSTFIYQAAWPPRLPHRSTVKGCRNLQAFRQICA